MQNGLPDRKHPAHTPPVRKHNQPIILFVTVCAKERNDRFANSQIQQTLTSIWQESNEWAVGYYLLMPDHIHLFCAPKSPANHAIDNWVRFWKRRTSISCPQVKSKWLRQCWDTQLRSQEMYLKKLEYVRENPVRAGLVDNSDMWPYKGVLNDLQWIL